MRRADWEERLHAYANEKAGKSFRWGSTDCGALVRGAMSAVYPGKPLGAFLSYRGKDAAEKTLEAIGGTTARLEESGAVGVNVGFVQCGDILILPGHDGHGMPRMGVMLNGGKVLTSLPGHGVYIGALELSEAEAWRLP
jgi:hypothetical protein